MASDDSRSSRHVATAAVSASATCVVTIDVARIVSNWRALGALCQPGQCAAVVKADAYGLGAARVVSALSAAGCRTFFVATFDEAVAVRAVVPADVEPATEIYVLYGLLPGAAQAYAGASITPVLNSLADVREWAIACRTRGWRGRAAIQVDSGMNRTGMEASEIDALMAEPGLLDVFEPAFIMSHLACGDDPNSPVNARQRDAFLTATRRFAGVPKSLAASAGILLGRDYHFDLVRPGFALYGGQPSAAGARLPVELAVTVEARVLAVRDVERGETVGYGAAWTAGRRSRIATVAIGYADGFARAADMRDMAPSHVAVCGERVPVVGRVSMDLVTIDVTDLADRAPQRGDLVEIIGPTVSLDDAARTAGTIGYEVLTRLSARATRVYRGDQYKAALQSAQPTSAGPHGQS